MQAPVVLVPVCLALALGCGEEEPENAPSRGSASTVVEVTRANGSTLEIDGVSVECDVSEYDDDVKVIRAISPDQEDDRGETAQFFLFFASLGDVSDGKDFQLPLSGQAGPHEVTLFVLDRDNELSAAEPEASGHVEVVEASCDPEPRLVLEIDATLGSEFSDGTAAGVSASLELE